MKNKIKIGHQVYKVVYPNSGLLSAEDGQTDFNTNTISVDKTLIPSQLETTLAHEILHVLIHQSGSCEIVKENEELLVRTMEDIFYTFLKENTNFYV